MPLFENVSRSLCTLGWHRWNDDAVCARCGENACSAGVHQWGEGYSCVRCDQKLYADWAQLAVLARKIESCHLSGRGIDIWDCGQLLEDSFRLLPQDAWEIWVNSTLPFDAERAAAYIEIYRESF